MTQPTPDSLIPWPTFLAMTAAEIDAMFGTEASRATVEITKDVRQLLTERTEEIREDKAS